MYQKNPLLMEFSPGDLMVSARAMIPHLKAALGNAKRSVSIVLRGKGKLSKRVANEFSKVMKKDPTLLGDVARGSETARQMLSASILQQLEPLPTADVQSIKQAIEAGIFALKRGNVKKAPVKFLGMKFNPAEAPKTARKALSNPLKSAKELVINRATTGTYAEMPINSYNGIISRVLGLGNMPIVDGSATMVAMRSAGISGDDLAILAKGTKDAYLGSLRDKIAKARQIYHRIVSRK